MAQSLDISSRIEGIARYLGATYPTGSLNRYVDESRDVVGFRFSGAPRADVEFARKWLETLPPDENGVAQEMHLRHVCAEINETPAGGRVVFTADGIRREEAART